MDQLPFAWALNRAQGTISNIERKRAPLSDRLKEDLQTVFFVDLSFFDSKETGPMFLAGKEKAAKAKARQVILELETEEDHTPGYTSGGQNFQAVRIEKLETELRNSQQMHASKDEIILLLKKEVSHWEKQFDTMSQELTELKQEIKEVRKGRDEGLIRELTGVIKQAFSREDTPDPNGEDTIQHSG